uniref:Uncharacterized protein n=1 Tax=Eucampia antarctica TaxID=49252 RepID=A0A7S2W1A2_9STRA|mmetsp:Transcript_17940/g.17300  ORF Transcript_17940/g.17300 Transcript_17940/m.17300 type:complete len:215 (+) Transcript_17940:52-696(+)|eukprot:CAMPEP_0197831578 /NCGR_PEP_ID=MMETSP1437-20131217/10881_1 /TAXON_ID=49252 ORGANISM="Eucampia antarctica, Strain CCMP1452" /NCGR_SAMPLE_ID=MMETSP1437 /ASSEMBLY_ACC=CAM_ASM_001096 /LENGTH=214 /DNA_ID=CAMNT_0043434553 /DNA_START=52 /DNA_END=696 /DNA_ORIENTATION=-
MSFMPHTEIPVDIIRSNDILLLLAMGGAMEITTRGLSYLSKSRSSAEISHRKDLYHLRNETAMKQRLGPSAFVETSKLERQVLVKEKELTQLEEARNKRRLLMKNLLKKFGWLMNIAIFIFYYGLPVLTINGMRVVELAGEVVSTQDPEILESSKAAWFFKTVFFPLSFIGMKLSTFGVDTKIRGSSIGALVVYWSAKAFCGKMYECLEALIIQ